MTVTSPVARTAPDDQAEKPSSVVMAEMLWGSLWLSRVLPLIAELGILAG